MPSNNFKTAVPVIASHDVVKTVGYFERVLGFEREWIWGDPPVYAGLRAGSAMLYISHDPELAGAIKERNLAPDIYFWVEDIHAIYGRHRASNAEIVDDLAVKPWGTQQYTVLEPNGYRLKIAQFENE
jgi:uncharacterized glyoxalase superfamily protein PhnB